VGMNGEFVGQRLGAVEGLDGLQVGIMVGDLVVGSAVGLLGAVVGPPDGLHVGAMVGLVGFAVGLLVGDLVGDTVGALEGLRLGAGEAASHRPRASTIVNAITVKVHFILRKEWEKMCGASVRPCKI